MSCQSHPTKTVNRMQPPLPLRLMAAPYLAWQVRHRLAAEQDAYRRQIADEADEVIAERHADLWDRFPAAAEAMRTRVRSSHRATAATIFPKEEHHAESPAR